MPPLHSHAPRICDQLPTAADALIKCCMSAAIAGTCSCSTVAAVAVAVAVLPAESRQSVPLEITRA